MLPHATSAAAGSQVRRRSSLDNAAALAAQLRLQQAFLHATSEDDEDEDAVENGKLPMPPPHHRSHHHHHHHHKTIYVKPVDLHLMLKTTLVSLVQGLACGVAVVLAVYALSVLQAHVVGMFSQDSTSAITMEDMSACVDNVTHCKQIPTHDFLLDWPNRFDDATASSSSSVYREPHAPNPHCAATCAFFFHPPTTTTTTTTTPTTTQQPRMTDAMKKISRACQLGCLFAQHEYTDNNNNCQFACKNTVWVNFPQKQTCNYDKGVGLATFEFERRFGEGVFGSGKACEFGCVLGNSRVCPQCDMGSRLM